MEPTFMKFSEVKGDHVTKMLRDIRDNIEYLCIEQDGNKVWLTKLIIDHLQKLSERWRIK
jgi:predicted secreted Zn-dependent protease